MYPTRTPMSYRRETIGLGSAPFVGSAGPRGPSAAGVALRWVRRDLDPRVKVAQLAGRFEQCVVVPCVRARVSGYEAVNARADYSDVE